MKIILEKGFETKEVKTGYSLYLLWGLMPWFGSIILLVLTILRKQFKGILLNQFVVYLMILAIMIAGLVLFSLIGFEPGDTILMASSIFFLSLSVYFSVYYILNANCLSLKQYLENGYVVKDDQGDQDDQEIQKFVEQAKNKKKPWFQVLKF